MLGIVSVSAKLPDRFTKAIHKVEASGKVGPILGDYNKKTGEYEALGPLQIHREYWQDSGVAGSYEQCKDLEYSKKVVEAYLLRFGRKFVQANNFEAMARIHNGGPLGFKNQKTIQYWQKVKKHL